MGGCISCKSGDGGLKVEIWWLIFGGFRSVWKCISPKDRNETISAREIDWPLLWNLLNTIMEGEGEKEIVVGRGIPIRIPWSWHSAHAAVIAAANTLLDLKRLRVPADQGLLLSLGEPRSRGIHVVRADGGHAKRLCTCHEILSSLPPPTKGEEEEGRGRFSCADLFVSRAKMLFPFNWIMIMESRTYRYSRLLCTLSPTTNGSFEAGPITGTYCRKFRIKWQHAAGNVVIAVMNAKLAVNRRGRFYEPLDRDGRL